VSSETPFRTLSHEKRLIKDLLGNYSNVGIVGRPVRNTSVTITIKFGLALIQILDLDEKNQILNTNVWSRYVRRVFVIIHADGSRVSIAIIRLCDSVVSPKNGTLFVSSITLSNVD